MLLLDVILRYPAISLMLLVAVLAWRDGRHDQTSRFAAYLSISAAALLLSTSPPELTLPLPAHLVVRIVDSFAVGLVWWFGRSMFEDDFRLGKLEWAGMLIVSLPTAYFRFVELGILQEPPMLFGVLVSVGSFAMMAHLVYITIAGRKDDMIETRRRIRYYFLIGLVAVTLLILIGDHAFYSVYPVELSIFRAGVILPLVLWGVLWLTQFRAERLSFQQIQTITVAKPEIDPRDKALHQALTQQMQDRQAFTETGLTIRSLAEQLNTPEHRLRSLINKGMGYRNFSSFVNYYRIEAVKQAMQAPENARTPILSLAMAVGFNSLAPFNRAFLADTGQTPSEYRAQIHQNTNQS